MTNKILVPILLLLLFVIVCLYGWVQIGVTKTLSVVEVNKAYTVTKFEDSNWITLEEFKGENVFFVINPSCGSAPCSGNKIWVDLDALEIYIEDENITYVDFSSREELIFYLGAELYRRNTQNKFEKEIHTF